MVVEPDAAVVPKTERRKLHTLRRSVYEFAGTEVRLSGSKTMRDVMHNGHEIEIRPLKELDASRLHEIGAGYTSSEIYRVKKTEDDAHTAITMTLEKLEAPYEKRWGVDHDMGSRYETMVHQGHSLGAYVGKKLVGIAIADVVSWNRTLWVWEFHIDPEYRGKGLGRRLMERLAEEGRSAHCRVMVCETQNTNVGAIRFYRRVGFEVGAIDLSYYTNRDCTDFEVAVFMKRFLE